MSGTKEDNYELGYTGSAYEGAIVNGRMEGSAKCYSFASGTKYEVFLYFWVAWGFTLFDEILKSL